MNKQKLALFILLIVLVLVVIWSFISFTRQKTVSTVKHAPGQNQKIENSKIVASATSAEITVKSVAKSPLAADDRTLRLELLEREQAGFKGYRRNIFRPIFTDDLKIMKMKSAAFKPLPVLPVTVVAPVPVPVQPVIEPETHQAVLARFTFLGYLKKDNRKTIFLAKDKEIILVRKGEIFGKRYEAAAISEQALTIRVIDTGEQIVIPLTENKPLVAASK